ncbi:hypothetical protein CVT26_004108 [Gymnopilus dilepis]|uniref:Uncharacterized protein n=1 Tax=Gymnopilus dilepis TaxID=231916 RepID=A0A409X385_9AGAR|nr:hypothetical protein CVT26_004108 [Gymnopilus dilepis]
MFQEPLALEKALTPSRVGYLVWGGWCCCTHPVALLPVRHSYAVVRGGCSTNLGPREGVRASRAAVVAAAATAHTFFLCPAGKREPGEGLRAGLRLRTPAACSWNAHWLREEAGLPS